MFNTKKVNRKKINKKLFSEQGNNGFYRKELQVVPVDIIIKQCIEANKGLTHNNSHLQNNKEKYIYLHVNRPRRCLSPYSIIQIQNASYFFLKRLNPTCIKSEKVK